LRSSSTTRLAIWPTRAFNSPTVGWGNSKKARSPKASGTNNLTIPLLLAGHAFQLRVWQELLTVQFGECLDLEGLSRRLGGPDLQAEVAAVVRDNPIALLIPSHRVFGWERLLPSDRPNDWLASLRRLEDLVPGESTRLARGKQVATAQDWARITAMSPSALVAPPLEPKQRAPQAAQKRPPGGAGTDDPPTAD
jgi:hypothetical protein